MKKLSILAAALLASFAAGATHAAVASYAFSGVTSTGMGGIAAGTAFSGTFSYDPGVTGVTSAYHFAGSTKMLFTDAFTALTLTIGGNTVTGGAPGALLLYNNSAIDGGLYGYATGDSLWTYGYNVMPSASGGSFAGLVPTAISFGLIDRTATAFNPGAGTVSLPTSLSENSFSSGEIKIYAGGFLYTSNLTSLTPLAAVPEPESYALMLAGLGLLGLVARRKRAG